MISFTIEESGLEDVISVLQQIPEFSDVPPLSKLRQRIEHVPHLILTVQSGDLTIGCKIGYERDGRFYSWLGAVLPQYRKNGIASALANQQEDWARLQGYRLIWMKTRNCFPEMLIMAIGRGFKIIGFEPREEIGQHRIVLQKSL